MEQFSNHNVKVKQDLQMRLRKLHLLLLTKQASIQESQLERKYKYVKHVETKKLTRRVGQLQRALVLSSSDDAVRDMVVKALEETQLYLYYIQYYPKDMKYISLFPKDQNSNMNSSSSSSNPSSTPAADTTDSSQGQKRKRGTDPQEDQEECQNDDDAAAEKAGQETGESANETPLATVTRILHSGPSPITSQDISQTRSSILARIQKGLESGEFSSDSKKALRMADVLSEDECVAWLAKACLSKSARKNMTKEERLKMELLAGKVKGGPSFDSKNNASKESKVVNESKTDGQKLQGKKGDNNAVKTEVVADKKMHKKDRVTEKKVKKEVKAEKEVEEDDFFLSCDVDEEEEKKVPLKNGSIDKEAKALIDNAPDENIVERPSKLKKKMRKIK
jgi:hypothetical protein